VASSVLLIGVGLALQTFFQDIIAGIFILIDQSVHVGDIVEIDGKVGRVEEIKLRTTRAVTIDNKVLIIPHHLYLTSTLYNWTQNGTTTRENVSVGVAYGSDVQLVKRLLLQAAAEHESVLKFPAPLVLFTAFGDSALNFKLIFTLNESFMASIPSSDLRFRIDELFRENNISIPLIKILSEENEAYEVEEAEDGLAGIEMIKKDDFDLVLCDIKMPKMDGVEVLEAVKKIKPETPMVMISGHGDLDTAVNTMRLGAFDYISKPPDLNRLLNTVRNALDRKELVVEEKARLFLTLRK